jgi:hypothetical protein
VVEITIKANAITIDQWAGLQDEAEERGKSLDETIARLAVEQLALIAATKKILDRTNSGTQKARARAAR